MYNLDTVYLDTWWIYLERSVVTVVKSNNNIIKALSFQVYHATLKNCIKALWCSCLALIAYQLDVYPT